MLKFSEIIEFSSENIWILKEFEWFEWFEWFGPSPIEPFNPGNTNLGRLFGHAGPRKPREYAKRFADGRGAGVTASADHVRGLPDATDCGAQPIPDSQGDRMKNIFFFPSSFLMQDGRC